MNFRLKKHRFCWSRKLHSSLNVTLTYFLDQSMKLHVLRQNQDFCCWFLLFDKWKQLRLMFCLLPFNTFYLELYLCHTNTGFLRMAMARNFFFNWCFADPWSQDWVRSVHIIYKRKTFRPIHSSRPLKSIGAGKKSSVVPSLDVNME